LGQAATGTGKTAAFALPLLHLVAPDAEPRERTAALILVPTRELAMQVAEAVHKYGKSLGVCALPIYGGASMENQLRMLKRGVDNPTSAIVFCRTRTEVDELAESLNGRGYRAEALHGGLSQEQRDRVMKKFRANSADLLIATDVAARGLDVQHVSHVVNYDVPSAEGAYVHRIGRTGRAGREGVAITLAEPREHRLLRNIEYQTKQKHEIAAVPTVADLRARRLELTRASIRETILAGDLDHFRVVVDSLAQEFDIMDV